MTGREGVATPTAETRRSARRDQALSATTLKDRTLRAATSNQGGRVLRSAEGYTTFRVSHDGSSGRIAKLARKTLTDSGGSTVEGEKASNP